MEAGEILLRRGLLTPEQLARVRSAAGRRSARRSDRGRTRAWSRKRRRCEALADAVGARLRRPGRNAGRPLAAADVSAALHSPAVAVSRPSAQRHARRRHERSVRSLSARRTRRRHRPDDRAGARLASANWPSSSRRTSASAAKRSKGSSRSRPRPKTASNSSARSRPTAPNFRRWPKRRRSFGS